jgi:hypothetical protein
MCAIIVLMKKALAVAAVVLGVVFLALAIVYWTTPASGLPSFFPGYDPTMAGIHFKHGLASLIISVLLFVYAWFATGKKKRA